MYRLRGVTKVYQKDRRKIFALRDVNLTIEEGEWLAIQGRTGHGKSTLLQMLGALDRPTSGSVELNGNDLSKIVPTEAARVRSRTVGFVFQTFNLIPTLTAQDNVDAGLVPLGLSDRERRRRASETLKAVGLGDRLGHFPAELSGGEQQRVAIARALAKDPSVLLADEPTGNLDTDTRDEIVEFLEELWRERGLTMVFVTHDRAIARRAPRVGVMDRGRLSFTRS
jgi:putative ABC transport system ATP-binding protein